MAPTRVNKVSDENLDCRVLGHKWKYVDAWKVGRMFRQTLFCSGCGTERLDRISSSGEVIGKSYRYPDGYLLEKGMSPIAQRDRGRLRVRLIHYKVGSALKERK